MRIEKVMELLVSAPGGWTHDRQIRLESCPEDAKLIVCGDEKTGKRFGTVKSREGRCLKIGSGGRNKTSLHKPYQIWAVWVD